MASVWRAWDETLRVERALKLLDPEHARDPTARTRFQTEARAMAGLEHPHVLRVHDVGQDGPWTFIVMELATGGTLWNWVERHGPMPPRLAVSLLLPVADALAAAHAAGVVHRDVKPQNVMIDAKGRPRVADFGIARVRGGDEPSLTRTGSSLGTWGYMAPEQRKDAHSVDARADVYALGATLWALLAGEVPVDLFAWDPAHDLDPGLSPDLLALIRCATRFEPAERPEDMRAMSDALEASLPGLQPIPAGTPEIGGHRPSSGATGWRPPAPRLPHTKREAGVAAGYP